MLTTSEITPFSSNLSVTSGVLSTAFSQTKLDQFGFVQEERITYSNYKLLRILSLAGLFWQRTTSMKIGFIIKHLLHDNFVVYLLFMCCKRPFYL